MKSIATQSVSFIPPLATGVTGLIISHIWNKMVPITGKGITLNQAHHKYINILLCIHITLVQMKVSSNALWGILKVIRQRESIFFKFKSETGLGNEIFHQVVCQSILPHQNAKSQIARTHNVVSMIICMSSFQTTDYLCLDCSRVGFYSLADKKQQPQERVNFLHGDTCRYTRRLLEILFKCTSG